ncbi:hypothetical protein [Streptomyces beijiangensis]|uniref:Secreted protein n=1 Tax=Streptomyces beijiangensis TaxID=163361 RepID=A0A939JFX0_9ACTN|nr:hypothetical protein [Streptomyces beijiangensis]
MAHPPTTSAEAPAPVQTSAPAPAPVLAPAPARRSAWSEGTDRLRAAATTEPGRLRIIGAVIAVLVVAFGAVAAFEISDRSAAADDVVSRSQPLSADAANIYRSLADADTAAASGFLAGAIEPADVQARYDKDIATASRLLVKAAANTDSSSDSGQQIAQLNEWLPRYTGLIERARANNRQGLPLGGAYLRYANQQMTTQLLPAAEKLYDAETGRLYEDYDSAEIWPYFGIAVGVIALGGLFYAQRRSYLRTNRVFNHGLVAATVASAVVLLWLGVGHAVARSDLATSRTHGQESLKVLNDARINSLKARANENLTLVARGAVLTKDGTQDQYEADYGGEMKSLLAGLTQAKGLAKGDKAGLDPVNLAATSADIWQGRHTKARRTDDNGDYDGALTAVIGAKNSTGECFDQVDAAIQKAIDHEQKQFTTAAQDGRDALTGLPIGAAVLAVLGAAGAAVGISRRLSEYR